MKKLGIILLAAAALLTSCGKSLSSGGGEVTGVRTMAINEPSPYGMVLIKRGSFEMGPADKDSVWGIMPDKKGISVDAFWMDETETTNAEYRQFVYWVRDSIIRERLADPAYGGNDLFKITEDRYGDPVTPHLDWSRPIPWKRANEDEIRAIESVYYTNPVTGEKKLDPKQMVYKYEWYDYTAAALRKNQMDPADRVRNTDIEVDPNEVIMISKDTAYIDEEGNIVNETITRPRSGPWDFLHTRIVNIYPDENCWVYKQSLSLPAGQIIEPFRLPTEGEWEYAARCGKNENKYPWSGENLTDGKDCFLGNFKPGKGNYTEDGHLITSRVGSFAANEFGLYDMAGNVSEWTSTAYSESGPNQMSDINPELRYNAAKEDPYAMKKKVVRGGSWKDVSQFIRSDMRSFEYQNETRSYIGFRCARTQIGFSKSKGKK